MLKHNQNGAANGLVISLVFSVVLLVVALGFGFWAYSGRQDYKNNVDSKVAVAVTVATAAQQKSDTATADQNAKKPLRTYNGPEAYGSLVVGFPKTWSAYVDDTGTNTSTLVDGYFYPNTVPSITGTSSVFALRVQVVGQSYSQVLQSYTSQQNSDGPPTVFSAYSLPKLPKIVGTRLQGSVQAAQGTKKVDMVILPLRSDTLKIWTEGTQFTDDFNNNILPNLSFSP